MSLMASCTQMWRPCHPYLCIDIGQLHLQARHRRIWMLNRARGLQVRHKLFHGTTQLLLLIGGTATCVLPAALRRIGRRHDPRQHAARLIG
jgi:hypothetical protein